jgi:hypothetical protein
MHLPRLDALRQLNDLRREALAQPESRRAAQMPNMEKNPGQSEVGAVGKSEALASDRARDDQGVP